MHFSSVALLSLATTTSLASVLPRSQKGSWAVSVTKSAFANGYQSQTVVANYTSKSYPSGIVSTCNYAYNPANTPAETSSCDNEAFSYEYDGASKWSGARDGKRGGIGC